MPSTKKSYSKSKISFKRSSSSKSSSDEVSEESSEDYAPRKYSDYEKKKRKVSFSEEEEIPKEKSPQKKSKAKPKGVLKKSSEFQPRARFSNLIVAIIENGQRNPPRSKVNTKDKQLYLRKNKWGNLANGLLVFSQFETKRSRESSGLMLCIGFQNTRARVNPEHPLASVVKLNSKAMKNLTLLEKKVGQNLEFLDQKNFAKLTNSSERKKVSKLVLEKIPEDSESSESKESSSKSRESSEEKYNSVVSSSESSEEAPPVAKKGWFEEMTGFKFAPNFKVW